MLSIESFFSTLGLYSATDGEIPYAQSPEIKPDEHLFFLHDFGFAKGPEKHPTNI